MIRVIERTTEDRRQEAAELWRQVQPLVYNGMNINTAIKQVKGISNIPYSNRGWYKEFVEYLKSIGINYRDFTGKNRINKNWRLEQ